MGQNVGVKCGFDCVFLEQVPVASWFDDMNDSELLDLIPFFEKLSKMDNVYTVLCNSNHPYNNSLNELNGPTTNNIQNNHNTTTQGPNT